MYIRYLSFLSLLSKKWINFGSICLSMKCLCNTLFVCFLREMLLNVSVWMHSSLSWSFNVAFKVGHIVFKLLINSFHFSLKTLHFTPHFMNANFLIQYWSQIVDLNTSAGTTPFLHSHVDDLMNFFHCGSRFNIDCDFTDRLRDVIYTSFLCE